MKTLKLGSLELSEISYGMWRISETDMNTIEIYELLQELKKLKINNIDIAPIYGSCYHDAEKKLGAVISKYPDIKKDFKIITKTGIKAREKAITPHYSFDKKNIKEEVERSLDALNVECIDLLLLHRPDVFADYEEVFEVFSELLESNKVIEFGASNFSPLQFDGLNNYLNKRGINLVTNQIELNNFCDEHIENDNVWYLKGKEISPMIWSPMGGGRLFEKENEIAVQIVPIAKKYNLTLGQLAIAFLKNQGLNPIIILGSNKLNRYQDAVEGLEIKIDQEDMYFLYKLITKKDIR